MMTMYVLCAPYSGDDISSHVFRGMHALETELVTKGQNSMRRTTVDMTERNL